MATVITEGSSEIVLPPLPAVWTIADLQEQLGDVPADRILGVPAPGTATKDDVERTRNLRGRICELVDGTLVEKAVGYYESRIAMILGQIIQNYLDKNNIGMVIGEAGTLEILSDIVRAADVTYIPWSRFPGGKLPKEPIPELAPDLTAEILSKSNTPAEMKRKRGEYFDAGVQLVWIIDPKTRTANVYTAPEEPTFIDRDGVLSGGQVLPGFTLALAELFARAEPPVKNE